MRALLAACLLWRACVFFVRLAGAPRTRALAAKLAHGAVRMSLALLELRAFKSDLSTAAHVLHCIIVHAVVLHARDQLSHR